MDKYTRQIVTPEAGSHKGDNGRVLVIGGSKLFHAASFWAAGAASKIVDIVHFSSPALENNGLMRVRAKQKFWDGIVTSWEDVERYIQEDDCILIGPGMVRGGETAKLVDRLIGKYPEKRWVVDGGALQEVNVKLLNKNMIVTPNVRELSLLCEKTQHMGSLEELSRHLGGVTILAKGAADLVTDGVSTTSIPGGNPGMTKGGTGDVLAGIVAGLYAKSPAVVAAVTASRANKLAGETLAKRVGVFFGASDLLAEIPRALSTVALGMSVW